MISLVKGMSRETLKRELQYLEYAEMIEFNIHGNKYTNIKLDGERLMVFTDREDDAEIAGTFDSVEDAMSEVYSIDLWDEEA